MTGVMQTMMTNYKTVAPFVPPAYVSSDLVLYYDPANPASYSGSGSTLTDLSPNGLNGTINNATYNSSLNSGVFTFVGSAGNQFIMTPNLYSLFNAATWPTRCTIEMWIYGTANGSAVMEVGQNSISTGWRVNNIELGNVGPFFSPRGGFLNTSNAVFFNGVNGSPGLNKWMHFCLLYNGTIPNLYNNTTSGTSGNSGTRKVPWQQSPLLTGQTANYYGLAFGAGSATNSLGLTTAMYTGRIGIVRVYSRELTNAEITTNYNGVKARYGL